MKSYLYTPASVMTFASPTFTRDSFDVLFSSSELSMLTSSPCSLIVLVGFRSPWLCFSCGFAITLLAKSKDRTVKKISFISANNGLSWVKQASPQEIEQRSQVSRFLMEVQLTTTIITIADILVIGYLTPHVIINCDLCDSCLHKYIYILYYTKTQNKYFVIW